MPGDDVSDTARGRSVTRAAIRAALIFAVAGVLWIVSTDTLVDVLFSDRVETRIQTLKGLLFVLASSALVFVLVRRYGRQWQRAEGSARASAEALRRSETRYRSLVERVPGIVYLNEVDPDDPKLTRCVYVAPQIHELLGYRPEEWMADEELWLRFVLPEDRAATLEQNDRASATGALSVEYRVSRPDGTVVWIHDEAVRIPADGDRPAYCQGVMVDITAQRVQDQALRELTESLRGVFDASPLAIVVLEPDGRVRHWNPAAERMFGWSAGEVIGRPLPYVPADRREESAWLTDRALEGEAVAGFETTRMRKDGERVEVSLSTAALVATDGRVTGLLGVLEDVTERKRIADELALQAQMLERRRRHQAAVAGLGLAALEGSDLQKLLDEASDLVAGTFGVEMSAILELRPDERTLVLRAGVGWQPGRVGSHTIDRSEPSLASYALDAEEPVIVDDLGSDWRFPAPSSLVDHGVVSGVAAVVRGRQRPNGVLEALSTSARSFTRDDVHFLQGIAVIVGFAIERDRVESALRTAEEKYRSLVEDGPAVVYLHDAEKSPAHIDYISPQIVGLLGYPLAEWSDDPLFRLKLLHTGDRERVIRADTAAIEGGEPLDVEYRLVAKDGSVVWVQDRAAVVRGSDGTPLFRQGVILDITDRRRAEEDGRHALERQMQLANRLEVVHQIDHDLLSAASMEDMAGRALDHLRRLVPYDRGSVAALDAETGRFSYVALRHPPEMALETGLESLVPDAATREVLATDFLVSDLDQIEPRTPYMAGAQKIGIRSVLLTTLNAGGSQVGVLVLSAKTANAFDEDAIDIAKEVGSELAIAIAQARLREAVAERAEELAKVAEERQQLLHRIVRAQEEERERVALELHDGLGQVLTSVSLFASDLANEVPEDAKARVARVNELIQRAIADSRQIVWSLRPPELERLGLAPALRRLADEVSTSELMVDLHEEIGDLRLSPESEAVVYRVVQEAIHNAMKHARASVVSILLRRDGDMMTTLVEDDGRGFDPAAVPTGRGLGLIGMRERAELVEGDLVVESAADAGTRVRLIVPITVMEEVTG